MLESFIHPVVADNASLSAGVFLFAFLSLYLVYPLFFHPLSHIPGPLHRRLSSLPLLKSCLFGTESRETVALHAKYGPIVLLGPNDVHINDGSAVAPIYVHKGGFRKAPYYRNSDIDGIPTIFSTTDHAQRTARAKDLLSLFSTGMLRSDRALILHDCSKDFVKALRKARDVAGGGEVDLLDLARRFSPEALSGYLFGRPYAAFKGYDGKKSLSVSPFVDSVVDFVRYFLFPDWMSNVAVSLVTRIWASREIERSCEEVDVYLENLVNEAAQDQGGDTYQKRLLGAGASKEEAIVQCKDFFFGGTDLTGTTMGMLLWNLVKNPECLSDISAELLADPNTPYPPLLRATLQEGLRTSLASPVRFPRVVPATGWTYTTPSIHGTKAYRLPADTCVGVSAYTLHLDENVYPDAHNFCPRRWLDISPHTSSKDMRRNEFAFGAGLRQCIARNLVMEKMLIALKYLVESEVLKGSRVVCQEVRIFEWFNARPRGGDRINIRWDS